MTNWTLLPPAPDVCQMCARDHRPELPHDAQHLYFQYAWYALHGRWPTWRDAMAHCTSEMQQFWEDKLVGNYGIDLDAPPMGQVPAEPLTDEQQQALRDSLAKMRDGLEAQKARTMGDFAWFVDSTNAWLDGLGENLTIDDKRRVIDTHARLHRIGENIAELDDDQTRAARDLVDRFEDVLDRYIPGAPRG